MDVSRFPLVPGPSPMLVTHSEGMWFHTSDGRRILDAGGGAIVTNIGHGRQEIAQVAADALSQLDIAWHNLMNTNCRMSGDFNEIIENKYPFCSSFDDVFLNDIKEWLKSCR